MSALIDYLQRADTPALKDLLLRQHDDAAKSTGVVTCPCGQRRAICKAYKCLYCGVWFCFPCAEIHFGKKFHEYRHQPI